MTEFDWQKFQARIFRSRRIDPETGCWIWTSSLSRGYPLVIVKLKRPKQTSFRLTRIMAWLYLDYDGNDEVEVCHRCNVKACFNPEHLYLAPHQQNVCDAVRDGLWSDRRGEVNPAAKLTESQVKQIRAKGRSGTITSIAQKYGVSRKSIYRILDGTHWKHVREVAEAWAGSN